MTPFMSCNYAFDGVNQRPVYMGARVIPTPIKQREVYCKSEAIVYIIQANETFLAA